LSKDAWKQVAIRMEKNSGQTGLKRFISFLKDTGAVSFVIDTEKEEVHLEPPQAALQAFLSELYLLA